jgi:hypothetical protein
MDEKQFIVWLHGYLEISGAKTLGEKELKVIKDHLNEFFVKVTPDRTEPAKDKNITNPYVPHTIPGPFIPHTTPAWPHDYPPNDFWSKYKITCATTTSDNTGKTCC